MALHDYEVRRGESVPSVAGKFCVSPEALRRANGLTGDALRPGERVRVPVLVGRYRLGEGETAEALAESLQAPLRVIRRLPDGGTLVLFIDE